MKIVVIDGQGGRLGQRLVESIKSAFPDADLMAVGTNSSATERMLKGGRRRADIIVGPLGIAMADSLMGEISPAMANAVASSDAHRVLIPMNLCGTYVPGVAGASAAIISDAMAHIQALMGEEKA